MMIREKYKVLSKNGTEGWKKLPWFCARFRTKNYNSQNFISPENTFCVLSSFRAINHSHLIQEKEREREKIFVIAFHLNLGSKKKMWKIVRAKVAASFLADMYLEKVETKGRQSEKRERKNKRERKEVQGEKRRKRKMKRDFVVILCALKYSVFLLSIFFSFSPTSPDFFSFVCRKPSEYL